MSKRGNLFYDSLQPGEFPHIWDGDEQTWKRISVMSEELLEATPITDEEARLFMETGKIRESTLQALFEIAAP
jgi:hypothetical protein